MLGGLRDTLLDRVLGLLDADLAVEGAALAGSLGRGEADNWSDSDLLILIDDQALAQFVDDPAARPWAQAGLLVDGRHNAPVGATSLGTLNASGARQPPTVKTVDEIRTIHLDYVSDCRKVRWPPIAPRVSDDPVPRQDARLQCQ